jgi:rhodanese-related sulfurtransferase
MKDKFLLDVRSPQEFQESHIKNSINIPLNQIPDNIEKIRQISKPILIICKLGPRAHKAQEFLAQNNIMNTKILEGGIEKHNIKSQ